MQDRTHDPIDPILSRRTAPPQRPELAARIIAAARYTERRYQPWFERMAGAFEEILVLPRPAYALAGCVALGFVLGLALDWQSVSDFAASEEMASFMMVDEGFINGGSL